MVGSGDKKYLVADFKGFSPVGYFPSFTVNGDASMGESFGRHMRDYSKPVRKKNKLLYRHQKLRNISFVGLRAHRRRPE